MNADEAFVVTGFIEDHATVARWSGDHLESSDRLIRRASLLVARRARFGADGGKEVHAALDQGPLAALLTVVRALDMVTSVDFVPWIARWVSVSDERIEHRRLRATYCR